MIMIAVAAVAAFVIPINSESAEEFTACYEVSGDTVGTYNDLESAFDAINADAGTNYTITAEGNDLGATFFKLDAGKNVTLTSSANETYTIKITTGDRHGTVNGSLTLENITLDGNGNGGGIEVASSGTLDMNSGSAV